MTKPQPQKVLTGKVAAVCGATTPLAALVCLKFIRRGARLLLIDDASAQPLARDMNVIWAGLDVNYAREDETDPWGARPVAAQCAGKRNVHCGKEIVRQCLEFFGRRPDVLVDVEGGLEAQDLEEIFPLRPQHCRLCIRPFGLESLWSDGWLEIGHAENVDPAMSGQTVSLFGSCSVDLLAALCPLPRWQELCHCVSLSPSNSTMLCRSDDLIQILTYVLYAGSLNEAEEFEVLLDDGTDCKVSSCRLRMENVPLQSLCKHESAAMAVSKAAVSCSLNSMESEDLDGCTSSHSDLFNNNGTFDAVLQKSKDYPIDWWEGGSECSVAMDDINFKVMTRAVINYTVRWLVLGYLVIGFAVPKALGWDGP